MCEYKVGDVVVRTKKPYGRGPIGVKATIIELPNNGSTTYGVEVKGDNLSPRYWREEYFELHERKASNTAPHVFKVGDKGITTTGYEYEMIAEHDNLLVVVYGRDFAVLATRAGVAVTDAMRGRFLVPPTAYVWRITCSGVRNTNGKAGLVDMYATRTYDSYDNAVAGYNRAIKAYKEVDGPFKEEKKS